MILFETFKKQIKQIKKGKRFGGISIVFNDIEEYNLALVWFNRRQNKKFKGARLTQIGGFSTAIVYKEERITMTHTEYSKRMKSEGIVLSKKECFIKEINKDDFPQFKEHFGKISEDGIMDEGLQPTTLLKEGLPVIHNMKVECIKSEPTFKGSFLKPEETKCIEPTTLLIQHKNSNIFSTKTNAIRIQAKVVNNRIVFEILERNPKTGESYPKGDFTVTANEFSLNYNNKGDGR